MDRSEVVSIYYPNITKAARKLAGEEYEDLVQSTVLRILSRSFPIPEGMLLEKYCIAETYREFYDQKRKYSTRIRGDRWKPGLKDSGEKYHFVDIDDALGVSVPSNQEDASYLNEIMSFIRSLPSRPQQVFLLAHVYGIQREEIAKILDIDLQRVKNDLYLTRQKVEAHINPPQKETSPPRVYLKDVVEACGLNKTAVSMVMRDKNTKNVSKEKREHILAVAKRLGYVHTGSRWATQPKEVTE